jgi:hypothetical protein
MPALDRPGKYVLAAAEAIVVDALRLHVQGLTNAEVGELTGLNPEVAKQRGYVTWSILQSLESRGIVSRVGDTYRLSPDL